MSLSFFDFQNNSVLVKRAKRRAFRTVMYRAFAATVANTEIVKATLNGGSEVTYMIDSGATYTILAETTAQQIGFDTSNPSRQQAITSVTGQTQANAFNVQMKINDTTPFQTEILVMPSAFNLLSTEDLAKAYSVTLDPGGVGFHLTPLGEAPTTPQPPAPTVPQQPAPTPPTPTPAPPQPPLSIPTTLPQVGNVIVNFLRQLYQMLCGMNPPMPVICKNPQIFMMSMMLLGVVFIVLMIKGMFG